MNTPVVGLSDLGITAATGPGPFYVGQNVAYTLTVSNAGPDPEPDATVTCPLSSAVAVGSVTNPSGGQATVDSGILTDDIGPLAAGATATVTVVLVPQAAAAGQLTMNFSIAGQNFDTNLSNNTTSATVTVTPASDLAIAISTPPAAPAVQADWTYTLSVGNLGLSDASDVTVLSPLPANVQLVSVTPSQGSYEIEPDGTLDVELDTLAADQSATVSIVVQPTAVGPLAVSASVSGDQYDPDPANNSVSATATVAPSVNLSVGLASTPQTVVAGKPLTFTATLLNTGPNAATGVVLNMPMSPGVVFNSASASAGQCAMSGGQLVTQIGTLSPGSRVTITVVATPETTGTLTQTASAPSRSKISSIRRA